ncbi:MAG TPA: ABC transporter permease subunit, partial [Bacillota bacterium]|nr:ABC transporter permease subunit [Bacillota bacterium]
YGIFLMRQYIISSVPYELMDAARIDGCNEFSIYWRIILPIINPVRFAPSVRLLLQSTSHRPYQSNAESSAYPNGWHTLLVPILYHGYIPWDSFADL